MRTHTVEPSAASERSRVSPAGTSMLLRTTSEQLEMLSLASEAEVKVQVEAFLANSETREGAGAAETREPTAARPRSW